MNKRLSRGKCIHCLKWCNDLTWDHILPNSWYTNNVGDIEKWKAPACLKCNNRLGKIEQELLIRLGLCLNPDIDNLSPTSVISKKALRSLDHQNAKNGKDRIARLKKAQQIVSELFPTSGSKTGLLPNFGYHEGFDPKEQHGIKFDDNKLELFGEKVIRGIEYKLDSWYIDNSFDIRIYFCDKNTISDVINFIRQFGKKYSITPDFVFYRAVAPKREGILYEIRIWDKLVFYGYVRKKHWKLFQAFCSIQKYSRLKYFLVLLVLVLLIN